MDPRSWLWTRKSLEKSLGESESMESVSSASEKLSDDKEALKASPDNMSPQNTKLPEVLLDVSDVEVQETVKTLTEKLSAALSDISTKEDLVKQHAKVAEEAVSGWEQAEAEVATLKQQLEATIQKNSALQERIHHLDEALKECARQLRESRQEQEEKVHDVIIKKTCEWESDKSELEKQIAELKEQLETIKAEAKTAVDHSLQGRFEAAEKENMDLKIELLARSKDIEVLTLERELCNQAAEIASKQNLENIKKVAKLEAECRRVRSLAHRTSSPSDYKPIANSICVESLTDSLSDSAERLPSVDTELGCSDSWATALIAELDQFKNEKAASRNLTTSTDIDLMDDFLEMERLVALPDANFRSSSIEPEAFSDQSLKKINPSEAEVEVLHLKLAEHKEQIERMRSQKTELEVAFSESKLQLEASCKQLSAAKNKLVELQTQLHLANEAKQVATKELVDLEGKKMALESQLKLAHLNAEKQHEKLLILEEKLGAESALSFQLRDRVQAAEAAKRALECQLESVYVEIGALKQMVGLLEGQVEEERALSSEYAAKTDNLEASRKALDSQLENAISEVGKLQKKIDILELKTEEERIISAESKSKVAAAEAARQTLELQLESAKMESKRLSDTIYMLEERITKERASSAELAAKCRKLDGDLLRVRREAELWQIANSNGELKVKKEKELAVAAGKLAECQKTIASLGQQLKSLTNLDEAVHEVDKLECNGGVPDARTIENKAFQCSDSSSTLGRASPASSPSSSSSVFSGLTKFLSSSRSSSRTET